MDPDVPPRVRVTAEVARRGRDVVVSDCLRWLAGDTDLAPAAYLAPHAFDYHDGVIPPGQEYWLRVWALRGLQWAWDESATDAVRAACHDEVWRVRYLAARVVSWHRLDAAYDEMVVLTEDPNPRVRQTATTAIQRIIAAED